MLRLNSHHAKTYFNENLNSVGPPQGRQAGLYQYSKESGYDQNPMSDNPSYSKLPLYDKRRPFSYRDQPYSKQQPHKLNIIDNQEPSFLSRQQGEAQLDRRLSFNQRPTQKPMGDFDFQKNQSRNSYERDSYLQIRNQKSDYLAKHQKRNQRIRNSLYRNTQPERREPLEHWEESENPSRYLQNLKDHQIQNRSSSTRRLNEEELSSAMPYYRSNNAADQTNQKYEQRDATPLSDRRQGASYGLQSDRINEIRRQKQGCFQFTPDKKQSLSSLPGSAERKQSLIQKSQELQKKLKNINSSVSSSTPNVQEMQANPYENRYEYGKRYEGRYQSRPSVFSTTNIYQRQGNTLYDESPHPQPPKCDSTYFQNKPFGAERKSPQPQDSALDKISQLNEKISQRIQSIISNYAKE